MQTLVLIGLLLVATYFMTVRPQAKRQRARQAMLASLAGGDLVLTRGGVIGRIVETTGPTLVIEGRDHVRLEVPRDYVEGKWNGSQALAA